MVLQNNILQMCLYSAIHPIDSPAGRGWPDYALSSAICGRLVKPSDSGPFEPMLLDLLTTDDTFTRWTLRLKPSLQFHDGRICSSEDLAFSITRHILSPIVTPNRMELTGIADVRCTDARTVEILLDRPNPRFYKAFFDPRLSLVGRDNVHDDLFSWRDLPVAAGPLKAVARTEAGGLLLASCLKNTQIHLFASTDPLHIEQSDILLFCPQTRKPSGFDSVSFPGCVSAIWGVFFNFDSTLMQDREIRREIRRAVYSKPIKLPLEYEPNHTIFPNLVAGQLGVKSRSSKAQLECSILSGKSIKILNWKGSTWCRDIVDQLKHYGIDTSVVDEKSACDIYFEGFVPHPYATYELFGYFNEGGTWVTRLEQSDEKLNSLFNEATSCTNNSKLLQLTGQLQEHFESECYIIPIMESPAAWYFKRNKISLQAMTRFGYHLQFDQLL